MNQTFRLATKGATCSAGTATIAALNCSLPIRHWPSWDPSSVRASMAVFQRTSPSHAIARIGAFIASVPIHA
ncbi:hypothetical protein [Sphingomonas faeni]|uniref:hypothetical protein n=1 Tax=Sphingomonas faeni TaxID=185950 RepID=UPI003364CABA